MIIEIALGIVLAVIILNLLAFLVPIAGVGLIGIVALSIDFLQKRKRQLKIILGIAIAYLVLVVIAKLSGH